MIILAIRGSVEFIPSSRVSMSHPVHAGTSLIREPKTSEWDDLILQYGPTLVFSYFLELELDEEAFCTCYTVKKKTFPEFLSVPECFPECPEMSAVFWAALLLMWLTHADTCVVSFMMLKRQKRWERLRKCCCFYVARELARPLVSCKPKHSVSNMFNQAYKLFTGLSSVGNPTRPINKDALVTFDTGAVDILLSEALQYSCLS